MLEIALVKNSDMFQRPTNLLSDEISTLAART